MGTAIQDPAGRENTDWTSSVYYAESLVHCPLETAWDILLDYEAWNPDFVGARVIPVRGQRRSEGELVLIREAVLDAKGNLPPEFYAETVKVVPQRHIVWCVYPKEGQDFRNFVDLGLSETPSGLKFEVCYYEQAKIAEDLLACHRRDTEAVYQQLATAFKTYCEAHI